MYLLVSTQVKKRRNDREMNLGKNFGRKKIKIKKKINGEKDGER